MAFVTTRSPIIATIAQGQTASAAVDLQGLVPVSLTMPAALTGATVALTVSTDGTNFTNPTTSENIAVPNSFTFGANQVISFTAELINSLIGVTHVKLTSAGAEAAARSFTIIGIPA